MSQSSLLTTTSLLQLRKRKAATAPPLKPKSTAWAHVDHIGDSSYKCLGVGCNKIFKLTSVTRLENHITGNGSDIAACLHPITEIRDVLLAKFEAKGVVKKSKVKVGASPSGHGAVGDLFGAARNYSTQEQCDEKFGAAVLLNTLPYSWSTPLYSRRQWTVSAASLAARSTCLASSLSSMSICCMCDPSVRNCAVLEFQNTRQQVAQKALTPCSN